MIRATLDTNVLVSALAGLDVVTSTPGAIGRHLLGGAFELVISSTILTELERAVAQPYFASRSTPDRIRAEIHLILELAAFVEPTEEVLGIATHVEDDRILATAVSGRVDFLVTGDKQLQRLERYQGVRILAPREFLALLESERGGP